MVGVMLQQDRKHPEQRTHQQHAAVAVLNVCRVDCRIESIPAKQNFVGEHRLKTI